MVFPAWRILLQLDLLLSSTSAGLSPLRAAEELGVHDLILPEETRPMLCAWMERTQHLAIEKLAAKNTDGSVFRFRA